MTEQPDFTTAARDHAEIRCTINPSTRIGAKLWTTHQMHDFGVAMAEWARDHLAAHSDLTVDSEAVTVESDEPTDAELADAAMDALGCELRMFENGASTCDLHGGYATSDDVCEVVDGVLSAARSALTAARQARP